MYYVYEWYIVETNEIIYVGKGTKSRYKVRKHNKFFNDTIRRYECDSRIIKEFETEIEAFKFEFNRINELKAQGQCVCNIRDGGFGGTTEWWTDDLRQRYSEKNIMHSIEQRKRMSENNPMKNPQIAQKTNGQKRRKVTIGDTTYDSIKDAKIALNISYSNIITWGKRGVTPSGDKCIIEEQKQYWHK